MGDYLDKLSEFVADIKYEDLSPDAPYRPSGTSRWTPWERS